MIYFKCNCLCIYSPWGWPYFPGCPECGICFNQNWKIFSQHSIFFSTSFFSTYGAAIIHMLSKWMLCHRSLRHWSYFPTVCPLCTLVWMTFTSLSSRSLILSSPVPNLLLTSSSDSSVTGLMFFRFKISASSYLPLPYFYRNSPPLHLFIHFFHVYYFNIIFHC